MIGDGKGNFQLASLGPFNSICVIIHLLGDPIDTACSLLTKLEVSRRLYARWAALSETHDRDADWLGGRAPMPGPAERDDIALVEPHDFHRAGDENQQQLRITLPQARDLATVNAVFDDWKFSSEEAFDGMHRQMLRLSVADRAVFITACTEAAHKLSESRADDRLRTYLAIFAYVASTIGAYLRTVNEGAVKMTGAAPPPPSRTLADAAQHTR